MSETLLELKADFAELKEAVADEYADLSDYLVAKLNEKKNTPFTGIGWNDITRARSHGGLSSRMVRAQMMKQRRRFRGRTGRKGHFLRMRPKLLRNLRKAMRSSARIKAVRHRKWTYRRSGSVIARMKGKMEKFTGRSKFRKKVGVGKKGGMAIRNVVKKSTPLRSKTKPAGAKVISIYKHKDKKRNMAAGVFYGLTPVLAEMFITDRVNGLIERDDMLSFLMIEAETVESSMFPLAYTVASQINESDVKDYFFDIDIIDGALYAFFEKVEGEKISDVLKELLTIGNAELIVKEGEKIDENYVSDFTVFMVAPTQEYIDKLVEEIVGDEETFIKECEKESDVDEYTSMLVIEKSIEAGIYDFEDEPDSELTAESVNLVDYIDGAGFETENVDEALWESKSEGGWKIPAGLIESCPADKAASIIKDVSESQEEAYARMEFLVYQNESDISRIVLIENIWNQLENLYN